MKEKPDTHQDWVRIGQFLGGLPRGETISAFQDVGGSYPKLEKICDAVLHERNRLKESRLGLRALFGDACHLRENFTPHHKDPFEITASGEGLEMFQTIDYLLGRTVAKTIDSYLQTADVFNRQIRGIANAEVAREGLKGILKSGENPLYAAQAVLQTPILLQQFISHYATMKPKLPGLLDQIYKYVGGYNEYLKGRFIKSNDVEPKNPQQNLIIIRQHDEEPDYIKIGLIEQNPILTEILLDLADSLPLYRERNIRVKGRKRKIKELSEYAITDVAERLMNISSPVVLKYIQNPKFFFERVVEAIEPFSIALTYIEKVLRDEFDVETLNQFLLRIGVEESVNSLLDHDNRGLIHSLKKIKSIDFNNIVQRPDDIAPENKREKDHFELREKMLMSLYEGMKELSRSDDGHKEAVARNAVLKAVDFRSRIEELLTSYMERRLRRDRNDDNEYYVGRQGQVGEFHFKREVTPEVKMEDVIGTSFDRAKKHLEEIIQTGNYPRLMRMSAPGKKVRSNILLIGPYGCGKTELARAVCADKRVIGTSVSVANTLTAYMHESVNNVKRIYDAAKNLRHAARDVKPVVLALDEFDGWFAHSEYGNSTDTDMQQIENILLEVLDGMEDYNGIITMGMTNKPMLVPKGIFRRFRYVDIVGELTEQERADMLKMYLERSLPVHQEVSQHYARLAKKLADAPGDVIRKVVDEIHFIVVPEFIRTKSKEAESIERILARRERNNNVLSARDGSYIRSRLEKYRVIKPEDVDKAIDSLLVQPQIQMQIKSAREVYAEAKQLLEDLSSGERTSFGLRPRSKLFDS